MVREHTRLEILAARRYGARSEGVSIHGDSDEISCDAEYITLSPQRVSA